MKKYILFIISLATLSLPSLAQQYQGMSGMIHVPTAEMDQEGEVRLGGHYLHQSMLPDVGFLYLDEKYNTFDYYASITPYRWVELSYICTERIIPRGEGHYFTKDRHVSAKFQLMQERQYIPALALGMDDVATTAFNPDRENQQLYFTNIYLAASKHHQFSCGELGGHLAYRRYFRSYNAKWNGLIGGLTFRPSFFPQARVILEYSGNEIAIGIDARLFKYFLIQASLMDFKYPSVGLCFVKNLL
ncbi:MAG: YjbH domain-containing protein [Bacteroidales bacterium]|nr:YjbH domain-containing protein [Bacteroidales bacterium]